jgi:hypothetical protein
MDPHIHKVTLHPSSIADEEDFVMLPACRSSPTKRERRLQHTRRHTRRTFVFRCNWDQYLIVNSSDVERMQYGGVIVGGVALRKTDTRL